MSLPKVLSFSGGQTSGYMLWREIQRVGIEEYNRTFRTLFCNTGKEHDKTLEFVHQVEVQWGVDITWLEYTRVPACEIDFAWIPTARKRNNLAEQMAKGETTHWFRVVNYETAKRQSESGPFDELLEWSEVLPNVRTRQCSVQMKLRTMQRFLRSNGIGDYASYIGMRNDEAHRKVEVLANLEAGEYPEFPLIDEKISVVDVNAFWDSHPFKLEIPNHQGNCGGCFLKARWKRIEFARVNPKAAQWWSDKEREKRVAGVTGDGARFQKGRSWDAIIEESRQPNLFGVMCTEEDVPCSCAVGGHRHKDDED